MGCSALEPSCLFPQGLANFQTFSLRRRQSLQAGSVMGTPIRQASCFRGTPACTGCKTPSEKCLHLLMGFMPGLGHTTGKRDRSSTAEKEGSDPDKPREVQATGAAGNGSRRQREPGAVGKELSQHQESHPPARPFGRQRLGRSFSSVTGPSE